MPEILKQSLLFPIIQSIHLLGLTMLVGTAALLDLRLMGIGLRRQSVVKVASALAPWTLGGLLVVVLTGPLLFWSDIPRYVRNPAFVAKMVLLVLAILQHLLVHRTATRMDDMSRPRPGRIAPAVSLILWSGVILAGRAIADFDIFPV